MVISTHTPHPYSLQSQIEQLNQVNQLHYRIKQNTQTLTHENKMHNTYIDIHTIIT